MAIQNVIENMDIVFVVGTGSIWEDNELRYSLRSVAKYLLGYKNIVIVGHMPDFIKNVIHIPMDDPHPYDRRDWNMWSKLLTACKADYLTQNILYHHDDHFWMHKTYIPEIPYYFNGDLREAILRRKYLDYYKRTLVNTLTTLKNLNKPTKNFDVHTPIIINRKTFVSQAPKYSWLDDRNYVVKSLYANELVIEGKYLEQNKLIKVENDPDELAKKIKRWPCFSTSDLTLNDLIKDTIKYLYPKPSPWEKA